MLCVTMLAASLAAPAMAASRSKLDDRVRDVTQYFDGVQKDPEKSVPAEILSKAEGLIIMRSYKAGFIVAVSAGGGVAIAKNRTTGKWGPVGFLKSGEGSFGFQAGGERCDLIMVLMDTNGLKVLTDPNFKLGVDIKATIGPRSEGEQANFKTDKTPVLVYGDTRGVFGGASVQTGGIVPDSGDNEDYYGKELTMTEILVGDQVKPTKTAKALAKKIEDYAKRAAK
jgi:lipid-binding SYLF domain-containing protein